MTAGLESDAAEQWLVSTLGGDATLASLGSQGVYVGLAPQGAAFPCIVLQQQAATDVSVVGAVRIFSNLLYLVRVIGQGPSYAGLKSIVARIEALLHRQSGSAADGITWGCVREQPFRLAEVANGIQYRHSGGVYRLFTTA